MLWYKGWLETRFRLLFVLVCRGFYVRCPVVRGQRLTSGAVSSAAGIAVWLICVFLAAAGIATQQSLQAAKGLHGSTLFTLTLPVSRFRLLAVRASLGWLEMTGGIGVDLLSVVVFVSGDQRQDHTAGNGRVCSRAHRLWVGLLLHHGVAGHFSGRSLARVGQFHLLWRCLVACVQDSAPASVNIFLAMGDGSPVLAHTMPWRAMAFCAGAGGRSLFRGVQSCAAPRILKMTWFNSEERRRYWQSLPLSALAWMALTSFLTFASVGLAIEPGRRPAMALLVGSRQGCVFRRHHGLVLRGYPPKSQISFPDPHSSVCCFCRPAKDSSGPPIQQDVGGARFRLHPMAVGNGCSAIRWRSDNRLDGIGALRRDTRSQTRSRKH